MASMTSVSCAFSFFLAAAAALNMNNFWHHSDLLFPISLFHFPSPVWVGALHAHLI